jgi:hypothetical protein
VFSESLGLETKESCNSDLPNTNHKGKQSLSYEKTVNPANEKHCGSDVSTTNSSRAVSRTTDPPSMCKATKTNFIPFFQYWGSGASFFYLSSSVPVRQTARTNQHFWSPQAQATRPPFPHQPARAQATKSSRYGGVKFSRCDIV